MPNATNHQGIHTNMYYITVTARLTDVQDEPVSEGRNSLRTIKSELIAGVFPF